jgi:RND family efflux transporter MFP subunit
VIARIAAPDLDAQLEQARAAVAHARAAVGAAEAEHNLALTTLQRYQNPNLTNAVAQQEIDTRRSQEQSSASALAEARTNVGVAEAEVHRLEALQGFEQVTAPFDGVITMRNFDPGALISASDASGGRPLFVIEQNDVLRVGVNVPQAFASDILPGTEAFLTVSNYPGREFPGKVGRTAGSIDAATRTLRVEVDVPNQGGEVLPGMYGQVRFVVRRTRPTLIVPTSALSLGAEGERVAVLKGTTIHLQPVGLGKDYGTDIEITQGLSLEDSIVNNPGTLPEGAEVETRSAAPTGAAGGK